MNSKKKIIIVLPAYNAEKTLKKTVDDIPQNIVDKIILVDDNSSDKTVEIAKKLKLNVIKHKKNLGYGANQKTCYIEALKYNPSIVVMLHPDYQYDSRMLKALILPIQYNICDITLGNRIRTRKEALNSGMPLYKYISNRFLTIIENIFFGQNLGEFHSGYRAYSKKVLETLNFKKFSNDFGFDSEFLSAAIYHGFRIGDIPVPVRYMDEASQINFIRSLKYGVHTLICIFKFILQKTKIFKFKIFKNNEKTK